VKETWLRLSGSPEYGSAASAVPYSYF
jgi:hypothetical protein